MTFRKDKHIDEEILKDFKPPFKKSKEDIWNEVFNELEEENNAKIIPFKYFKLSIAASITLLICVTLIAKFYTTNIISEKGQYSSHILPDGSKVSLNVESHLSYHPFWWSFDRKINMEGEAFFEVEKGSKFSVLSNRGTTSVLGTSFNINTRNNNYNVYCKTGKVRVENNVNIVELTPNLSAFIGENKELIVSNKDDKQTVWMNGDYHFTSEKLKFVFEELERQYNISILYNKDLSSKTYTGYFNKNIPIDSTLQLICKSFGITFEKNKQGKFQIQNK